MKEISIKIDDELYRRAPAEAPSLRELFADVRGEIGTSGVSEEELDVRIESALKEVRKQHRA